MKNYKKEIEFLLSKINSEGFDYCFEHYSTWDEIKDKKFHLLKRHYLTAKKELKEYIMKVK